ncbi:MAG: hypothetical protein WD009_00220 [Phycisphaeraceae bacterium]
MLRFWTQPTMFLAPALLAGAMLAGGCDGMDEDPAAPPPPENGFTDPVGEPLEPVQPEQPEETVEPTPEDPADFELPE